MISDNKKLLFLFLLSIAINQQSCVVRVPVTNAIALVNEESTGVITIEVTGLGVGMPQIEQDAKKKAIESILYNGLPSSVTDAYRLQLIDKSSADAALIGQFFDKKQYEPFVNNMKALSKMVKVNSQNNASVRFIMTIQHEALRRFLEDQNIVRKFGY